MMLQSRGYLLPLAPLLFAAQATVDPSNPWVEHRDPESNPGFPRLDEFSSDEEDIENMRKRLPLRFASDTD